MGVFVDFGRIFMHLLASITGTGSLGGGLNPHILYLHFYCKDVHHILFLYLVVLF